MTSMTPVREQAPTPTLDYGVMYSTEAPGTVHGPFASAQEASANAEIHWMFWPGHVEFTVMVRNGGSWHDLQGRNRYAAWHHRWSRDVRDRSDGH